MARRDIVANIENLLPLSPMQEGMLYHSLSSGRFDIYLHQVVFTLEGRFEIASFEATMRVLAQRHLALRSGFIWRQGDKPVQVVRRKVELPVEYLDWRGLDEAATAKQMDDLLRRERLYRMDLANPPLLRLCAIRTDEDTTDLLWNMHHILMDGWSLALIVGELVTCYGALLAGREPTLPPLQPYERYIAWLQKQPAGDAEAFWRRTLEGFRRPAALFSDPAPEMPGGERHEYRQRERVLPVSTTSALASLSHANRVTLNSVVQGAWALLLSRYSECDDVVFGATSSGRPSDLPFVEAMVGNFMNTLPVRVRVDAQAALIPWLQQIQRSHVAARQYEYAPLVDIQRWSELPPATPLFESIVVFENYPVDQHLLEGKGALRIRRMHVVDQTNYPLTLVAGPGTAMRCRLLYDRGSFSSGTVDRMLEHLETLLEAFTANPAGALGSFPMVSTAEKKRYTVEWNRTARAYGREDRIPDLFERAVVRHPSNTAIISSEGRWSYGELNARANRVARLLTALGVGRGDVVALLMDRRPEAIAGLLGILKAGAAYVPIEPAYPDTRAAYILSHLSIRCVLTSSSQLPRIASMAAELPQLKHAVTIDDAEPGGVPFSVHGPVAIDAMSADNPRCPATSCDLAYVIFTSGSTGEPKGVTVRHQPAVNLIEWVNTEFNVDAADRLLFITSFCFDLSVYDMFGMLAAGGAIRLAAEDELRDPDRLITILRSEGITFWDSAPAAMQQIAPFLNEPGATRGSRLRLVFLSGDWIPVTLPDHLMDAFPGVEVISLGGATEATVWSNYYAVSEVQRSWTSIPYGRPIQNARYYILDRRLEPQPPGLAGDLWIGGECLSDGYWGHPALTAEAFLPDPFADAQGARMYRTGDLARFYPDGNIEFLGRRDQQVKIRGFRIELGEIEAALARHPAVEAAVVVAHGPDRTDRHLAAYVVPGADAAPVVRRVLALESAGRLNARSTFELPDGSLVAHRNRKETEFSFREIFEQRCYLRNGIALKPGACVFDVGANIGLLTCQVLRDVPSARVYAFEPLAPVFESLRLNAELYGPGRVKSFCCALGKEVQRAEMTYYPALTIQSGFYAEPEADRQLVKQVLKAGVAGDEITAGRLDQMLEARMAAERQTVEVRTLSEVIAAEGVEVIDLLKVNVERSEVDVLAGIAEPDWARIRQIVLEAHSEQDYSAIAGMLERRGYTVEAEAPESLAEAHVWRLYARQAGPLEVRERRQDAAAVWLSPGRYISDLRAYLRGQLPDYMTPAHFVLLPALPTNASGKVDRNALPAVDAQRAEQASFVPPEGEVASALAGIWTELLGVERVGMNDSFFELGGDSILSIQAAARANRMGLALTPRDFFEKQTIAELAGVVHNGAAAPPEMTTAEGEVPLTPIQQWWFEQPVKNRDWFTQSVLLRLAEGRSSTGHWQAAIAALLRRHDALQMRFRQSGEGGWQASTQVVETGNCLAEVDFTGLPDGHRAAAWRSAGRQARRMDLSKGPLFRGVLARLGGQDELLLAAHHLVTDPVSWRSLLEDLARACDQLSRGIAVSFDSATTSFRAWAAQLRTYGATSEVTAQRQYWEEVESLRRPLPRRPGTDERYCGTAVLAPEGTRRLLQQANGAYHTRVEELLLAALAPVLSGWLGERLTVIDIERHGRQEISRGLDVSRTVGWFTTLHPLVLEDFGSVRETVNRTRDRLRATPGKGLGYGLLRRESPSQSWGYPAGVVFNYLGHIAPVWDGVPWLRVTPDPWGMDPRGWVTTHPLAIAALVVDGTLQIRWDCDSSLLDRSQAAALCEQYMNALRGTIDYCCSPEAHAVTSSDAVEFGWSESEFDQITAAIEKAMAD